jgi:hypothetical protein
VAVGLAIAHPTRAVAGIPPLTLLPATANGGLASRGAILFFCCNQKASFCLASYFPEWCGESVVGDCVFKRREPKM